MGLSFHCDDQWFTLRVLFVVLFLYAFLQKKEALLFSDCYSASFVLIYIICV